MEPQTQSETESINKIKQKIFYDKSEAEKNNFRSLLNIDPSSSPRCNCYRNNNNDNNNNNDSNSNNDSNKPVISKRSSHIHPYLKVKPVFKNRDPDWRPGWHNY